LGGHSYGEKKKHVLSPFDEKHLEKGSLTVLQNSVGNITVCVQS
jgi:hypothetical protein